MRLLCLELGADRVYSPEIIDHSLVGGCERIDRGRFVDFSKAGRLIFRCSPIEKKFLIAQLGTASPERAVAAAKLLENDVSGININCGCPKKFSLQGGMGAALLMDQPRLLCIVSALFHTVSLPISCKIRLLEADQGGDEATIALCVALSDAGAAEVAIHARTASQNTNSTRANWSSLCKIASAVAKERPFLKLIANGDFFCLEDIEKFQSPALGFAFSAIMIARGASRNPAIFQPLQPKSLSEVTTRYLELSVETETAFSLIKFTLLHMWPANTAKGKEVLEAKSISKLLEVFNVTSITEHIEDTSSEDIPYIPTNT